MLTSDEYLYKQDVEKEFDDLELDDDEEEDKVDGGILLDVAEKLVCPMYGCQATFSHDDNPIASIFDHTRTCHEFDFHAIQQILNLDIYGCMKLVNYVRYHTKQQLSVSSRQTLNNAAEWLKDETYLKPVMEEDPLLFAFDDINENELDEPSDSHFEQVCNKPIESLSVQELRERVAFAEWNAAQSKQQFVELMNDFKTFKQLAATSLMNQDASSTEPKHKSTPSAMVDGIIVLGDHDLSNGYFDSYSHSDIHETMLKDQPRTEAYRDFMYRNKNLFKDKIVMDVGCGTGILSMFAARAGAKRVICIDNSKMIFAAKKNAQENNLDHLMDFVYGQVEDLKTLPSGLDCVDIIVSEWMGYFLLFEGMLDSVLHARDAWLAPDGFLAPSQSNMFLATVDAEDVLNDSYYYWQDVYGFKMSIMQQDFHTEARVNPVPLSMLTSDATCIKHIDMNVDTVTSLDFSRSFSLEIQTSSQFNGLCGWFDVVFDHSEKDTEKIVLSTGCDATLTHWQQCLFLFKKSISVEKGMSVRGTMDCKKSTTCHRDLDIVIQVAVYDEKGVEMPGSHQTQAFKISS